MVVSCLSHHSTLITEAIFTFEPPVDFKEVKKTWNETVLVTKSTDLLEEYIASI
jgi:hypothetical protein